MRYSKDVGSLAMPRLASARLPGLLGCCGCRSAKGRGAALTPARPTPVPRPGDRAFRGGAPRPTTTQEPEKKKVPRKWLYAAGGGLVVLCGLAYLLSKEPSAGGVEQRLANALASTDGGFRD